MINSTTSTDRAAHPDPVAAAPSTTARPKTGRPDQLSTENAAYLREALARQPEIRPEVVERGRNLASDPNYPSLDILKQVSAVILTSPDLTDTRS